VWEWGCPKSVETWNGRAAMIDVLLLLVIEITTGEGFYVFIMFFIFIYFYFRVVVVFGLEMLRWSCVVRW
jgi:hypothetical protein